ncbi:MAG: hypothetical protein K9L95_06260 [Candidatus Omnitrophica bacterium]|nr:hypothetical protein [Candidatus Omnitrophota bacterium]MCF7879049.1 hypothetical protein [Candidatus Omnitrophota bacterium]
MELSILVARILALIYLSAGISVFCGRITLTKIIEDFKNSPGLTYISGFLALALGMILVTYHNIWVKNWTVLITIVAWMSLLKGVMLIVFPQCISCFKNAYKNNRLWGVVMVALGVLFGYFGFLV